jgi:hypothetical protein
MSSHIPSRRHRVVWLAWLWRIAFGMCLCVSCLGCRRAPPVLAPKSVAECRISFHIDDRWAYADVCLADKALINDLILQPMRDANRDPAPAAYAIAGTLTIISSDGSRESFSLYSPWGHYRQGNDYFVADFSKLKTACEAALRRAERVLDTADKEER